MAQDRSEGKSKKRETMKTGREREGMRKKEEEGEEEREGGKKGGRKTRHEPALSLIGFLAIGSSEHGANDGVNHLWRET